MTDFNLRGWQPKNTGGTGHLPNGGSSEMDGELRDLAAMGAAHIAFGLGWKAAIEAAARTAQVQMLGMDRARAERVVAKILAQPCPTPSGCGPIGETET